MKKIFFLSSFLLSALSAHECHYKLDIELDTNKGLLTGTATIESDHPSMQLVNSKANITTMKNATLNIVDNAPHIVKKDTHKDVQISFTHHFKPIKDDVILLDTWYPKIDMTCRYETTLHNSKLTPVVEATKISKTKDATTFTYEHPLRSLHLVASKNYVTNSTTKDGMKLSTYLYEKDKDLSETYLKKSQEYFTMYKQMFGFIPFKEFSIVETPFPAGYSMPTYTLIGEQIINKDFILESSLGHEIAHQWFGAYTFSPEQGNWVEGMTTFYADYLYAKNRHEDVEYRKQLLIKYNSFVSTNNEIRLIEFTHKQQESKNAIGYGKAAFFFYMLEQKIGKKSFEKGIQLLFKKYPYKTATYKNLREIFEEASGAKLLEFFKTWVYKKGALEISLNNTKLNFIENRYILEFDAINNVNYGKVPVSICSDEECVYTNIDLSKTKQRFELDIEPNKLTIDENYKIFRKLVSEEIPPVISKIIEGDVLLVIDRASEQKFAKFKHIFKNFKYADQVSYDELRQNNIFILGKDNALLKRITIPFTMEGDAKIEMFKNPLNENNVVAVFDMNKLSRSIFYKLRHLGKYSTVVFNKGKIVQKSTKKSQNGISYTLSSGSYAIKPQAQKLSKVIQEIAKNKIVFIGEKHTEFASHLNQLKIIKAMYKHNKKLAIGMEMFQKPFQKYLDAFIAGKISEKEMLKKTEYFTRWKYDYELYRPIILFAKEKKLPIVALNVDRDITKKVVSEGMDALSKKQKAQIPNAINFENDKYKKQLRSIFGMHSSKSFKNFDEFYHAQLIWDESMAKNIVKFLKKKPDYSMAVLAGNGHIMFGYGIPSRVKRLGLDEYIITLNMTNPEPGIADYLLYPSNIKTLKAKKIGFYPKSKDNLEVTKIVDGSLAQKANMQVGDVVIAINDHKVKNLYDLKRELAFVEGKTKLTLKRGKEKVEVMLNFTNSF